MPSDPPTPPRFSERGVAMVEFAVVLPVLAMLVVALSSWSYG
jgi:Flp pilus assembly protein TadG